MMMIMMMMFTMVALYVYVCVREIESVNLIQRQTETDYNPI